MRPSNPEAYPAYPKTPRWYRDITVTEKIDGTNGLISIRDVPGVSHYEDPLPDAAPGTVLVGMATGQIRTLRAGSRERWLTPSKSGDNYGFSAWVHDNAEALAKLGPGDHYGEWWGLGIQRRYGVTQKVFSLFNVRKTAEVQGLGHDQIRVVPVLYTGPLRHAEHGDPVQLCMMALKNAGSQAAPGFADPEGVIVYHHSLRQVSKVTFLDDHKGK